jgi:hypothetical protein
VKIVTGVPPNPEGDNGASEGGKVNNIPPPKVDDSQPFKKVAERMKAAVNISASPCDDFLSYACGKYDQKTKTPIQLAHETVSQAAATVISKAQQASDVS